MLLKLIAFGILMFINVASQAQNLYTDNGDKDLKCASKSIYVNLKILKIESIKHAYLIDAIDLTNDYLYQIVSLKSFHLRGNRVKEGSSYCFILYPYFLPDNSVPTLGLTFVLEIKDKVIVVPSKSWMNNIYLTKSLDGLRYGRYQPR